MTYRLVLSTKAGHEIAESWEWYEDKQAGLGDRFKRSVYDCIKRIEEHPEHFPKKKKSYREAKVDVFPFLVIYAADKKQKLITILSVFHTSRNPRKKYTAS